MSIFHLIITYRTDLEKLRAVVPEPLEINQREPLVKYEFIRMPDSTGFGDYTESGQVIPVSFRGRRSDYTHCMFLNDEGPIAGGRELWGFPKKLRQDCVEEAWRIVDPVLMETTPVYEYEAGSWGPHEMDKKCHAALRLAQSDGGVTQIEVCRSTCSSRLGCWVRGNFIADSSCRAQAAMQSTSAGGDPP